MAKSKAALARAARANAAKSFSARLAAIRSDWRWAGRHVVDARVGEVEEILGRADQLAFDLAQDIDSGRVELDLPDEPRPLFDGPSRGAKADERRLSDAGRRTAGLLPAGGQPTGGDPSRDGDEGPDVGAGGPSQGAGPGGLVGDADRGDVRDDRRPGGGDRPPGDEGRPLGVELHEGGEIATAGDPERGDGYTPDHPWYYKLGGRTLAVEEITPAEVSRAAVEAETKWPKSTPRLRILARLLGAAEEQLGRDVARYRELIERGWEAISEYERGLYPGTDTTSSALDEALSLKHGHISYQKGRIAGIRAMIVEAETSRASIHDDIGEKKPRRPGKTKEDKKPRHYKDNPCICCGKTGESSGNPPKCWACTNCAPRNGIKAETCPARTEEDPLDSPTMESPPKHRYDVYLAADGEEEKEWIGIIDATDLIAARAQAPETYGPAFMPGVAFEVEAAAAYMDGRFTEVAECATCGHRWPADRGVGCPNCIHGPIPDCVTPEATQSDAIPPKTGSIYDKLGWHWSRIAVGAMDLPDADLALLTSKGILTAGQLDDEFAKGHKSGELGSIKVWAALNALRKPGDRSRPANEEPMPPVKAAEEIKGREKKPRHKPRKTFKVFYHHDDESDPILLEEIKARDFGEARAALPRIYSGNYGTVRLPSGDLVKIDIDKVELVQPISSPRAKKEVATLPPTEELPDGRPDPIANLFKLDLDDPTPPRTVPASDDRPLADGCRIIWTDRDGAEWHGQHRFTLGKLARLTLDPVQPGGRTREAPRAVAVDPSFVRREPSMEVANA